MANENIGKKLTKAELVEALTGKLNAEGKGYSKAEAQRVLESVIGLVSEKLVEGNTVELRGLGIFSPKLRPERVGRNPRTGESITTPAHYALAFKAGSEIKNNLKNLK